MVDQNLLGILKNKYDRDLYPKLINDEIIQNPDSVDDIIAGLISGNKRIRANCAEIASIISEQHPGKLYPYVDVFVKNLDSNIPKLRCYAVSTLGNLAEVDKSGKVVKQIKPLAQNLTNDSMKIQDCSVKALSMIAKANPKEAERIFNLLISHKKYFPKQKINIILENLEYFRENKHLREDAKRILESYAQTGPKSVQAKALDVLRKFSRSG